MSEASRPWSISVYLKPAKNRSYVSHDYIVRIQIAIATLYLCMSSQKCQLWIFLGALPARDGPRVFEGASGRVGNVEHDRRRHSVCRRELLDSGDARVGWRFKRKVDSGIGSGTIRWSTDRSRVSAFAKNKFYSWAIHCLFSFIFGLFCNVILNNKFENCTFS